jgi:nitrite reductase/ring-hydroxylating ferredoxin subunit
MIDGSGGGKGMPVMVRTLRRVDLPEDGVMTFEVDGAHYVVADIEGEVQAFAVSGPVVRDLDRATIAEGRLRCAAHGWPIDAHGGGCGAAAVCRYDPVPVEVEDEEIRVALPGP